MKIARPTSFFSINAHRRIAGSTVTRARAIERLS